MADRRLIGYLPPEFEWDIRQWGRKEPESDDPNRKWELSRLLERAFAAGYDQGYTRGYQDGWTSGRDEQKAEETAPRDLVGLRLQMERHRQLLTYLDKLAAVEDAPIPLTITHEAVRRILTGEGEPEPADG